MQYVRSLGGSVSKTWNSINPATLSGAIDVIVVEQEDGILEATVAKICGRKAYRRRRIASMLALPRPIWEVLFASPI